MLQGALVVLVFTCAQGGYVTGVRQMAKGKTQVKVQGTAQAPVVANTPLAALAGNVVAATVPAPVQPKLVQHWRLGKVAHPTNRGWLNSQNNTSYAAVCAALQAAGGTASTTVLTAAAMAVGAKSTFVSTYCKRRGWLVPVVVQANTGTVVATTSTPA